MNGRDEQRLFFKMNAAWQWFTYCWALAV